MITVLSLIFVFVMLVLAHELGHFLAAKSVGIRVERFYIGFNLFGLGIKKKIGHTEYGLGLIPLGGYVKVAGIVDESMDTQLSGAEWEFQSKNALQKIWFMSAGVLANMLLAVVIFTFLTLANGISEADTVAVAGSVSAGFPAEEAGIQPGDEIRAIDGIEVSTWEELTTLIHDRPDEELEVTWIHQGDLRQAIIKTRATEMLIDDEIKLIGLIGIGPKVNIRPAGFGEAWISGCTATWRWFVLTYKSLGMIITGKAGLRDIGGPIFIAQLAGQSAQSGFSALLGLLAIISVNLAFINVLPIPALDGGHIAIVLVETVRRKPLSLRARLAVQQFGVMVLLALIAVIFYNDIMRLFN